MNPPTSFKTNVNRAKTKRWVEAKSYSYDGDDWGEADDYDEYNGYDEPTPPAKPTGFRQPGQAVGSPSSTSQLHGADSEGRQDYRTRNYGDLSTYAMGPQKQDAARSATNPEALSSYPRDRVNSFDRNDEMRSFSAGGMPSSHATAYVTQDPTTTTQGGREEHQPSARFSPMGLGVPLSGMSAEDSQWHPSAWQGSSVAPPLQVQTQFPTYGDRLSTDQVTSPVNVSQTPMHREPPRQLNTGSRTHSITSTTPSMDLQNRRDFSPSALPPPLHPRASPAPQSATDDASAMRFPPRKSSLSQQSSPYTPNSIAHTQGSNYSNNEPSSAGVAQAEAVSPGRERAGSNAAKPLPFVRPADIYKRMEEEREKARRSQESGRPSMDSITGRPVGEASGSATESSKDISLSDDQGKRVRQTSSMDSTGGDDVNKRLKPVLDPVVERRSEYGFEGFHENIQPPTRAFPSAPSGPRGGPAGDHALKSETTSTYQDSPVLPSVLRVSGFGDDFMKDTTHLGDRFTSDKDVQIPTTEAVTDAQHLSPDGNGGTEQPLQHQPSLGFRSVVNQAFDGPEDRSVPPTPSTMGGSGVARTNSESTTGVSPIMSRVPSAATAEGKARATGVKDVAAPSIAEEVNETSSTPTSSGILGTPMKLSQTPPPVQPTQRDSADALPHAFRPGHRRDLSTPSPGNSPARSPAVEAIHSLPSAEQVEMASATPIDARPAGSVDWPQVSDTNRTSRIDYTTREADTAFAVNASPVKATSNVADIVSEAQSPFLESRRNTPLGFQRQSRPESPISRNESPTKGKVRDLADRFEAEGSNRRGSATSTTSKIGVLSGVVRSGGDLTPPRPLADRSASFRPKLPGGWESYAPTSGVSTPGKELSDTDESPKKSMDKIDDNTESVVSASTPTTTQKLDEHPENDDLDITPTTVKRTLSVAQADSPMDPFTAVAAAGNALAGAFAAVVGLEHENSQPSPDSLSRGEAQHISNPEEFGAARGRSMSVGTSGPVSERSDSSLPNEHRDPVSALSSGSPAPSPRDLSPVEHEPLQSSESHSSLAERKQGPAESTFTYERPVRPQMLPSLSTESGPQDYESDRLRKEIVRSLSPRTSRVVSGSGASAKMQDTDENSSLTEPISMGQGRESAVLPKEYESYWNGSSDEDEVLDESHHHQTEPHQINEPEASSGRSDQSGLLPRRFSWEQDSQEGSSSALGSGQYVPQEEDPRSSGDSLAGAGLHLLQANFGHLPSRAVDEDDNATKALEGSVRNPAEADDNQRQEITEESFTESKEVDVAPVDRDLTPVLGAFNTTFVDKAPADLNPKEDHSHDEVPRDKGALGVVRPGIDKEPSSGSDRPSFTNSGIVQYTPEAPSDRTGQLRVQDALEPSPVESGGMPGLLPSPPAAQPKIVTFREILTLKSPAERIRAYNNTREQFSNMDTGLNHWITATIDALPEHAELLSRGGRFESAAIGHRPSPSRGKLLKTSPTSATMQQPYYQQYLNASSQPATSSSGSTLPIPSATGSQGFSPSGPGGGARVTSQQVQAKGKDLLHSAGLLGGKANHAAKGLFSKGKSKFRGSGGVEKDGSRNASPESQPPPHLDSTPPPYFDHERQPKIPKRLSTGSRPVTVFDDPYRKRPFSTVLPERPFSYAPYNDFDLPPSTPPGREFPRLGILPSPTVDATPTRYNDVKEAAGDNASEKPIGKDVATLRSRDAAGLEQLEPPAFSVSSAERSSSRSSPVQANPAMVGDVPVYLKTSASSQVSALSSEKGAEEASAEAELEPSRQSNFSESLGHSNTFTSTPPVITNAQGTLPDSNEHSRQLKFQNQPSSTDFQTPASETLNGSSGYSSRITAPRIGTTDTESLPSFDNDIRPAISPQTKPLPPASHWYGASPNATDGDALVSGHNTTFADASQGLRNLSGSPDSAMLAPERPSQIQEKPRQYPGERNVSPLPVVVDSADAASNKTLPLRNATDSEAEFLKNPESYESRQRPADVSRPDGRFRSDDHQPRSPDVSPERQQEIVVPDSDVQQQSKIAPPHETEPQNQSRVSKQAQSRPFSFVQYSEDGPTLPSQDEVLREQQWEPGYQNHQETLQDGKPSFGTGADRSTLGDPSNQQEAYTRSRNENLRHSSTVPYRHHPSLSGSSYDPNIHDHPAYRQRQQPVAQDLPSDYYPAETRRDEGLLPRHQGTEYQLTGIGPPQTERNPQKRRSSSRSSNFFKGLGGGSSSRPEVPKIPSVGGRTTSDAPSASEQTSRRVFKRASIFRSFTQRHGSDSGRSNDSIVAQGPGSRTDLLQQSGPITPRPLQDTLPSDSNARESQSNSFRKRMQRRSTPGDVEAGDGKKKRFSLRNLFARFGSTKHSPSASPSPQGQLSPPPPPTQRPTLQPQQSSAYFAQSTQPYVPPPEPTIPQNRDPGRPPPPGGYYAPEIRVKPKSGFVGGRRLSEQQVGEARHTFESQTGFRGPYHASNAHSRTPDLRYQDLSASVGPSGSQYAMPSATTDRPSQYSNYGSGYGTAGPRESSQPPSQYVQHPPQNQWGGQSDYITARPFAHSGQQVSPQVSRPDLQAQFGTPPANWTSSTSTSQPINTTQPSRPYTHNFSLHHRVDSPYQGREDSPQPRQRTSTSTPNPTTQTKVQPPPPPPKSYTPPVPPKDDRLPFLPGQRQSASAKYTPSSNPNLISQLSSRAAPQMAPRSRNVDREGSDLEVAGDQHQHQQRGWPPKGAVGAVSELDANNGRRGAEEEEEEIVMSSTAYPGQEWAPSNYGHWEDD